MYIVITIVILIVAAVLIMYLHQCGVISSDYQLTNFDEKRVILRKTETSEKEILWDDICAIFPHFSHKPMKYLIYFAFELRDGENAGFKIRKMKRNTLINYDYTEDTLEKLYDYFLLSLKKRKIDVNQVNFSHPSRWIRSKHKYLRTTYIGCVLGVLAMIYVGKDFKGWGPYLFPLPFVSLSMVIILLRWLSSRRQKCLQSVRVYKGRLIWRDESGRSETRTLSSIRSFELYKSKGLIEFHDGIKLRDLEKLRYWPILREYLLSKLEPSEKK